MDEYSVKVCYPWRFNNEDGEPGFRHSWLDTSFESYVEAKNQAAANAIVQKKIDAGEFDGTLLIPPAVTGNYDDIVYCRPYILLYDTTDVGTLDDFL